ncbi:ATP-binding protein [Nocardia sp. NBC_01327]|uniref:ATP-binding protein n=1 Tax=Nocardia sp. NBC_01327 TaxID=2903593 RepID=UPI002E1267A5|nr:ATP-binding protein [Nocardia sp. NBC_01327]
MTTPLSSSPGDEAQVLEFDLETTPGRWIRDAVRELLAPDTSVVVEDALLVVDEMVANPYEHGSPPRHCQLALRTAPARLRIEVEDCGTGDPHLRVPDRTGGRGMIHVDKLATEWAVIRYEGFKVVWAELPLDRPHSPPMATASLSEQADPTSGS